MSDEQESIKPCTICYQQNEQMLMLSCIHDPCINCAAIHYVEAMPRNSVNYRCEKCGVRTELDPSSISELERVYSTLGRGRKKEKEREKETQRDKFGKQQGSLSTNYTKGGSQQVESFQRNQGAIKLKSQEKEMFSFKNSLAPKRSLECPNHPQDQLTYYCFTCSTLICPECAIHGTHHSHQVQSGKRAVKQLKSNLTQLREKLSNKMNLMSKGRERGKNGLKDEAQKARKEVEDVKNWFGLIRSLLIEKEKEVIRSIDQTHQSNSQQIRNQASTIDSTIEEYHQLKKTLDSLLKSEDLVIFEHYSPTEQLVLSKIESPDQVNSIALPNQKICDLSDLAQKMEQVRQLLESVQIGVNINKNGK